MFELREWKRKQRGPFRHLWTDFNQATIHNNITFVLRKFHAKKCVSSLQQQNKVKIYTDNVYVYVYNNQSSQQALIAPEFSRAEMTSHELNVSDTASVNVKDEIPLPFGLFEVGVDDEFPSSNTYSQSSSHPVNITVPTQLISVDAFSRVKVSYHVYRYEDIHSYLLDFELDDSSTIPDLVSNGETIPLKEFIRKYFGSGQFGKRGLQLEYSRDKLILGNFQANERIVNHGIDIEIGIPQKIR